MYVIVQVGIDRHRKTRALRRLTGWPLEQCIGALVRLWQLCIEQSPLDGILKGWTTEDFEDALGFKPDALLQAGLLSVSDSGGYCVPDWEEHTGKGLEQARRQAEYRARHRAKQRGEKEDLPGEIPGEEQGRSLGDNGGDHGHNRGDNGDIPWPKKGSLDERNVTERNLTKKGGGGGQASASTGADRPTTTTTTDLEFQTAEPPAVNHEAPATPDPCIDVYRAWRQGTVHPSTHPESPPPMVWKAIRDALARENADDVLLVARQAARDPWLRGEKPDAAYPQGRLTPQRGLIHALSPKRFASYVDDARAHRAAPGARQAATRPAWEEPESDLAADSEGLAELQRVKAKIARQDMALRVVTGDA